MKKLILIVVLMMLSLTSFSQMCNTGHVNMGTLTMTTTFQNVTNPSLAKRFWVFNAVAGCTYDFSTCGSLFTNDTYLRLYSGTNPLTAILQAQNDDNGPFCLGNKASLTWTCVTTGVYSILVTNYLCANLSASTILSYRQTCAPPYNPCGTIPTINCGVSTNLTVASGNGIYNPPTTSCGFTTPGREYIYTFTPTTTGNYTISQPTSFGYIDWFYKPASSGCNGTGWTCIDDITNGNVGNANVNIPLTAGVAYYIMADPESTGGGNVNFTINCPIPPVVNDNCINAINITSLPYTSPLTSNNPSTNDVPTSVSGCGTQGSNVWYKVIGNGNEYIVTTCDVSTNFDTEIRVYTGTCAALNSMVEVVCNDDDATCSVSGIQSKVNWCTSPLTEYYISVGYYSSLGGTGNFRLNVTEQPTCIALPIELMSFYGKNNITHNTITWETATESNNDYFTLERSIDGINWKIIRIEDGAGFSNQILTYTFDDYNFEKNYVNYYRLRQTDYNGVFEIFNIISVNNLETEPKKYVIKRFLIDGREIPNDYNGLYIEMYNDGTARKVFKQ